MLTGLLIVLLFAGGAKLVSMSSNQYKENNRKIDEEVRLLFEKLNAKREELTEHRAIVSKYM